MYVGHVGLADAILTCQYSTCDRYKATMQERKHHFDEKLGDHIEVDPSV
jgi:hypothetical protein